MSLFAALEFYVNGMDGIFKLLTSPAIVLRRMGGTSVPGQHWSCFPQRIKPKSLRQVLMPVEDIGMLCHKQSHPLMKEFCPFQLEGPLMLKSIALFQFTNSLICSGAGGGGCPLISLLVIYCGIFCFSVYVV